MKSLTILLIDDQPDITESIGIFLRLEGHTVHIARNGQEGIAEAQRCMPHIIILDIGLPDLDGLQVAQKIRALPSPSVKQWIIALSGYAPSWLKTATSPFDNYLIKPPDILQLQHIISNYQAGLDAPDAHHS
ncbi:response regulator [Nitrosomonas sp. JL21]|uniref:response regulator n=1 Tax=Nitrosomonas sp. JL21 TaxID=153949 RepID=UPI00136B86F4|nr:response regulator [Nitrosomonas sp. JL21]MBL8498722.1 response regulator [Nitrosomonas sp.]MCC7091621.1 response regulator [Nitrosomonas sp.]MXS77443.1 response regulator [Nitrosomonas sp. JL21]